ncbi:hypothetical protein [Microbacterium sp. CFBP9034]|uniref:hypothetical protein n=1 Tax=Microbacterium sp. CFBP9034 TaxID=3096540 RepID=UPI002A6A3593|nr:hypothetical protein [Microbacterium sp. CFBP9034]MDY0908628.1 hypothetical protein [Microbacterium sp. CFBP9034]
MAPAITTAEAAAGVSTRTAGARPEGGAVLSWAAVAAWGAGLIELALGAGAMTQGGAARGAGVLLVALGAGGLVWGAATLARGRIVVPRAGIVGALAGIVAGTVALASDPVRTSILAVAAGSALLLAVALACAARLRRKDGRADAAAPRLGVLLVAAVLVAALVTPALGATEAGRNATGHGTHGFVEPGHH